MFRTCVILKFIFIRNVVINLLVEKKHRRNKDTENMYQLEKFESVIITFATMRMVIIMKASVLKSVFYNRSTSNQNLVVSFCIHSLPEF